ncbi:hypothetical protein PJP10_32730, partial [Mycobacterium kansasii]
DKRQLRPVTIHHNQPSLVITTIKPDGSNYLEWSPSAKMYIESKRKLGYITSNKKEPTADNPSHEDWKVTSFHAA